MGKSAKKRQVIEAEIEHLKAQKRVGLLRAVAAFLGMFIVIGVKTICQFQGQEWANTPYASWAMFILAIVAAGIAGMGTHKWSIAKKNIERLESQL